MTLRTPPWDPVELLKSEADIEAYLQAVVEERDPGLLEAALRDVARARALRD